MTKYPANDCQSFLHGRPGNGLTLGTCICTPAVLDPISDWFTCLLIYVSANYYHRMGRYGGKGLKPLCLGHAQLDAEGALVVEEIRI